MKKQLIRKGVFETNSSSTHSLTIESDGYLSTDQITPFTLYGEFGWSQERYYDFDSKFAYIYIYLEEWVRHPTKQVEFPNIVKNALAKLNLRLVFLYDLPELKEETKALTAALQHDDESLEPIVITLSNTWNYIDHQSVESCDLDYLFTEEEDHLINFLFNPNSFVETDNDNH